MPFDRSNLEAGFLSREALLERLNEYLSQVAGDLRNSGFAVQDDCRVDMEAFRGVRSERESDKHLSKVEKLQEIFKARDEARDFELGRSQKKGLKSGEQLEALKTIIFHKFLGEQFFTMRTSLYDDFEGGVDNLIIEKETGNVVGAFDEVVDMDSGRSLGKEVDILNKNLIKGGGSLEYGFEVTEGGKKVSPSGVQINIPVFHLGISKDQLEKGVQGLTSLSEKSDIERELFLIFFSSIERQIEALKNQSHLYGKKYPRLKRGIDSFGNKLNRERDRLLSQ